jgi:hypothetical protein
MDAPAREVATGLAGADRSPPSDDGRCGAPELDELRRARRADGVPRSSAGGTRVSRTWRQRAALPSAAPHDAARVRGTDGLPGAGVRCGADGRCGAREQVPSFPRRHTLPRWLAARMAAPAAEFSARARCS